MKHKKLILFVLSLCISSSIFAMELERSPSKQSLSINRDEITPLDRIHQKINDKHSSNNKVIDFFKPLTEENMLTIINTPDQWCEQNNIPITSSLLTTLYRKNQLFEKAVDHFTKYAHENFNNVTIDTICFVADPDCNQRVSQLNALSSPIKRYVMSRVYDKIESRYTIDIPLSATAVLFKICPPIHKVATYSKDKHLHLWDLTSGKHEAHFPTDDIAITLIQFNDSGSKMGTVAHGASIKDNSPKSRIIIWNTYTQQQLHQIIQDDRIYHMDFMQGTKDNNILVVYSQEKQSQHKTLTLWLLNQQYPEKFGYVSPLQWEGERLVDIKPDDTYGGTIDPDNDTNICITKKISPALHLCQKAVENHSDNKTIDHIKTSQTYVQNLTEYEQKMIYKQIIAQKTLSAIIPLHYQHARK